MPCNSNYLDPTSAERNSQRVAKLLAYVFTKGGLAIPSDIKAASYDCYGNTEMLDKWVQLLCKTCTAMTPKEKDAIIYNAKDATSRDLADWWEEHERADRERQAEEMKEKNKAKLRKQALAKLSKNERLALDITD